ncbi:Argininosuccinate lyase [Pleurostoma richardsiae]|uniref:Arginosuccinase n=1 Tax=Pleurostoma richardsiae TaxID=41990 RepID=A0AA38RJX0_9PEZI|nr:Argininosuccinate lyase [Pleurostoma richardsiae]
MSAPSAHKPSGNHDTFFWLGQINKSSLIINADEGLLDHTLARKIAAGLHRVLQAGDDEHGSRPSLVITFEPLLIEEAGVEATGLHAGRSSQDMVTTAYTAALREETLRLADQLLATCGSLVRLAEAHTDTIVPCYTNGVAAQPNSYGHVVLGHVAGVLRDLERLQEYYRRLDRCPMGTTVLNGTGFPLNRNRMAAYLGFSALAENAYDAVQITAVEMPVELGALATAIALHAGAFIQDVMVQYAMPRPWILLKEGNGATYVSSAMPQKRNPGLLNNTRAEASRVVTLGVGRAVQAHNIPPGMPDGKALRDNMAVMQGATGVLVQWEQILNTLYIKPERALEELNRDWTASQELADTLMRCHGLPFRVGHHFASELVDYARTNDICPSAFPYAQAQSIYDKTLRDMGMPGGNPLPMDEAEFRAALDPVAIVRNRVTVGGPQPAEMMRMLKLAKQSIADGESWVQSRRQWFEDALSRLDTDFKKLLDFTEQRV